MDMNRRPTIPEHSCWLSAIYLCIQFNGVVLIDRRPLWESTLWNSNATSRRVPRIAINQPLITFNQPLLRINFKRLLSDWQLSVTGISIPIMIVIFTDMCRVGIIMGGTKTRLYPFWLKRIAVTNTSTKASRHLIYISSTKCLSNIK